MEYYQLFKTMLTIVHVGINNGKHAYKDAALLTLMALLEDEISVLDEKTQEECLYYELKCEGKDCFECELKGGNTDV